MEWGFYPRPPGGGRQQFDYPVYIDLEVSIHALRVEGDYTGRNGGDAYFSVSIHALRVEGDGRAYIELWCESVSIHALRVEGDGGDKYLR